MAFRDIHPQAPTHVLIIPKKHAAGVRDLGDEDMGIIADMHRVAQALAKKFDPNKNGFRMVVNNGPAAGQAVAHLHCHFLAGRLLAWPPG